MRTWTVKINGKEMFSSADLDECAKWVNTHRNANCDCRCSISSFMTEEGEEE